MPFLQMHRNNSYQYGKLPGLFSNLVESSSIVLYKNCTKVYLLEIIFIHSALICNVTYYLNPPMNNPSLLSSLEGLVNYLISLAATSLIIATTNSVTFTRSSTAIRSFVVWISSYPTARFTVGIPNPAITFASLPPPLLIACSPFQLPLQRFLLLQQLDLQHC